MHLDGTVSFIQNISKIERGILHENLYDSFSQAPWIFWAASQQNQCRHESGRSLCGNCTRINFNAFYPVLSGWALGRTDI